jgi:hypothetical protein
MRRDQLIDVLVLDEVVGIFRRSSQVPQRRQVVVCFPCRVYRHIVRIPQRGNQVVERVFLDVWLVQRVEERLSFCVLSLVLEIW